MQSFRNKKYAFLGPSGPRPLAAVWTAKVICTADANFITPHIQDMLKGPKTFLGNGVVRDVSLVEYLGKTVVVKTLRPSETPRDLRHHLDMHNREMLTLDAVSDKRVDCLSLSLTHPSFKMLALPRGKVVVLICLPASKCHWSSKARLGCIRFGLRLCMFGPSVGRVFFPLV